MLVRWKRKRTAAVGVDDRQLALTVFEYSSSTGRTTFTSALPAAVSKLDMRHAVSLYLATAGCCYQAWAKLVLYR